MATEAQRGPLSESHKDFKISRRAVLRGGAVIAGGGLLATIGRKLGLFETAPSNKPAGTAIPAAGAPSTETPTGALPIEAPTPPPTIATPSISETPQPSTLANPVNSGYGDLPGGANAAGSIGPIKDGPTTVTQPDKDPIVKENNWNKLTVNVEDDRFGFKTLEFNPQFNHPRWGSAEQTWEALTAVMFKRNQYIGELLTENSQATRVNVEVSRLIDIDVESAITELKSGKATYKFPTVDNPRRMSQAIPQMRDIDATKGLQLNWRVDGDLTKSDNIFGNVHTTEFDQWRLTQADDGQLIIDSLFQEAEFAQPYSNAERSQMGSTRYLQKTLLLFWLMADPKMAQGHNSKGDVPPELGKRPQDQLIKDLLFQRAPAGSTADGKNIVQLADKSLAVPLLVG